MSSISWAQKLDSNVIYTFEQVENMGVFPRCESIEPNDKLELKMCMLRNLNNYLADHLLGFADTMIEIGIDKATSEIEFIIDVHGKIVEIEAKEGGTPELGEAAIIALQKITNNIAFIEPAKIEGKNVNMLFKLPIRFIIENETFDKKKNRKKKRQKR